MQQVFGTAQTVINTSTDIAAGNFSGAPSAEFDNTSDAAVPYALYATATAVFPDWAAAPTAGSNIELWGVRKNVNTFAVDDTDPPSGTSSGGAQLFGIFPLAASDTLQRRTITIDLLGVVAADFYFKNGSGVIMNNDAGTSCSLVIIPFTIVP